jgi:hypothetical protein
MKWWIIDLSKKLFKNIDDYQMHIEKKSIEKKNTKFIVEKCVTWKIKKCKKEQRKFDEVSYKFDK